MEEHPDYIELEEEHIEVLSGLYQLCPLCFSKLGHRHMPGYKEQHWFCPSCNTEWDVRDFVNCLNYNELEGSNE